LRDICTYDAKETVFDDTAGNRVLQIKRTLNKWDILRGYYEA
jgi:hypothetical protein